MYFIIFLILQFFCISSAINGQIGYFCVPIADLIAEPSDATEKDTVQKFYDAISISPEQGKESCIRKHQGIFNEQVIILDQKNLQYYVELVNCFYQPVSNVIQPVRLWARADTIVTHNELRALDISSDFFPEPYSYSALYQPEENFITLTMPWHDPVSKVTYCVGTRFVMNKTYHDADYYGVLIYNHATQSVLETYVPKNITAPTCTTAQERRNAFVALLYSWCTAGEFVPFVWGGTSFNQWCNDDYAVLAQEHLNGTVIAYWERPFYKSRPFSGFDASGLILRAAQICGIPYYCVNSTSVSHNLRLLGDNEIPQEGDIIWAPGYVGVIGSLDDNELIEAQGYARGYGKVHAIALEKRFAGITSWDDFLYNCNYKIPFESLDSKGNKVATVPTFVIFKLPT